MALTYDGLTFRWSKSEEQLGNLSDVALSTFIFSDLFEPIWFDCLSKLTLDLEDDPGLNKRKKIQMYICMRISWF